MNLIIAAAFAVLYLWFTSDMVLEGAGHSGEAVLTRDGGVRQAAYLVLQGLLYILNSGVTSILEPDSEAAGAACRKIAGASTVLIMALTVGALAADWPSAYR